VSRQPRRGDHQPQQRPFERHRGVELVDLEVEVIEHAAS